jgi:hypothetical protein
MCRVCELMYGFSDVLEQLASDERFRVEGHIADASTRAVEVRRESQTVDTAGRAAEHGCRSLHAQTDAKRAERGTHALWLIVRTLRVIARVTLEDGRLSGRGRCIA